MNNARLLIVEDDPDISNMLRIYFGSQGYQVDVDCVQHQLNAQQDGDSVAPRHHTEQANAKECSRKI